MTKKILCGSEIEYSNSLQESREMSRQNPIASKVFAKSLRAARAIRKLEPEFDAKDFPGDIAQKIYIDAHRLLAE